MPIELTTLERIRNADQIKNCILMAFTKYEGVWRRMSFEEFLTREMKGITGAEYIIETFNACYRFYLTEKNETNFATFLEGVFNRVKENIINE